MKTPTIALLLMLLTAHLYAQNARFVTEGSIEFEKSINMHAQIRTHIFRNNESAYMPALEQYKKTQPQFKLQKSTLLFSGDRTLFIPEEEQSSVWFDNIPAAKQNNIIYTDLVAKAQISQKRVFEETFLVKDSTRRINWKITSEMRDIAGYSCRRANAIIMDSVYVVAFYTDEIHVSGGPESFTGLPGMILGVALPHENITWFAKLVTYKPVATSIVPPQKGKVITIKEFTTTLKSLMTSWGSIAGQMLKSFLL